MENNKLSSKPPKIRSVKDFILEADSPKNKFVDKKKSNQDNLPWEMPQIRKDVQKVFTVKLPEEYIIKIKYLSDQTNKSQQKIVRDIIQKNIDDLIKKL